MGQSPHSNSNVELGCMGVQNAKMFALETVPVKVKGGRGGHINCVYGHSTFGWVIGAPYN